MGFFEAPDKPIQTVETRAGQSSRHPFLNRNSPEVKDEAAAGQMVPERLVVGTRLLARPARKRVGRVELAVAGWDGFLFGSQIGAGDDG